MQVKISLIYTWLRTYNVETYLNTFKNNEQEFTKLILQLPDSVTLVDLIRLFPNRKGRMIEFKIASLVTYLWHNME